MIKYKFLFLTFLLLGCITSKDSNYKTVKVIEDKVVDDYSVPIFPKKSVLTTDTSRRFSVELPKRCSVDWENQKFISIVPSEKIEIIRLYKGEDLPKYNVKDYKFNRVTVKTALENLLKGTDIEVIEDENLPVFISGSVESGTLQDSVELITKMGRIYYYYDNNFKEIHLVSYAKWLLRMPKDENIIMALLDAMRGIELRNLLVNWEDKTIEFEGDYQTEKEILRLISDIDSKKYMIAWDVDVYRVYPRTENPIIWMNVLYAFGQKNIKMSIPGVVGRTLVVNSAINTKTLQEFLSQQANVVLISQGSFVIPNNWSSRFDIGQCSREERLETELIIGAKGSFGDYAGMNKIMSKIVLYTERGELSSFDIPSNVGDNYVITGIPTHSFVTSKETTISPFAELVIFMSPKIIKIVDSENKISDKILAGDELRKVLNE